MSLYHNPFRRSLSLTRTPLAVLLFALPCYQPQSPAQTLTSQDRPVRPAGTVATNRRSVLPAESLGPDDLIELEVSYCPELSRTFRVGSDGSLALPLIHKHLAAAGLSPTELGQLIEKVLVEEHLLADPIVTASVLEYRSRPVSVVGAVNHPLTFQATGQSSLLDALAQAGGLSPSAGGGIIVTYPSRSGMGSAQGKLTKQISVKDLLAGDDPSLNLELRGGEEIRIPEATKIFVAGNVRHPGLYPMQGDSDTTVIKAITLSQGLDAYSSANAFIYRKNSTGASREEVKIPLSRIMAHKSPDVPLFADDILYVPSSDGKRITSRVLGQIAGFGQTAGTGLLIYK